MKKKKRSHCHSEELEATIDISMENKEINLNSEQLVEPWRLISFISLLPQVLFFFLICYCFLNK